MQFADLNLSPELMRALEELQFTAPTPIQAETLPKLLEGDTDFLGLAATGTGKTAAFAIPLLERLDPSIRGVQALVLCPTRELAIQVAGQIDLLGKFKGVRSLPIYGGTGYSDQLHGLRSGAQIVVGTPGRVVDHIEKGTLRLEALRTLVLDEADEMISMGFKEDLEAVLKAATTGESKPSIWLFSATMGTDVKHVADAYLTDPAKVQVNRTEMLPDTVEQIFYKIHEYDKPELLCKVIDIADDFYGLVFCQTKALVTDVHNYLLGRGYKADALHGDLDQKQRDRVMASFRDRKISVLVATDVACRGLDVKDVTHVVNYSLPRELDNYVHRIGRTARSGKKGTAISFVTFSHRELVGRIERLTKRPMIEAQPPTLKDIAQKRIDKVRAAFNERGAQGRATAAVSDEWKAELEAMPKEEIVGRFLNLMMPDAFAKEEKTFGKKLPDSRAPAAPSHGVRAEKSGPTRGRPAGNWSDERPAKKPFKKFGDKPAYGDRAPSRFSGPSDRPAFKDRKKPWSARSAAGATDSRSEGADRPAYNDRKTPPWEKKTFSKSGPGAPRWKNNFSKGPETREAREARPESSGELSVSEAIARDSRLPSAGGTQFDRPLKKKGPKKLYGKWKERANKGHGAS